tara:strand:+ start:1051 stop:1818 length:768 start_codon:yes stop_codon:yes gene_type:complete
MTFIDQKMIYYPERTIAATPADVGLEYEDAFLTTSDGVKIHGWWAPGGSKTTLLWFHGNGGNIGDRVENLLLLHDRLGVSVFILDYRGYGRSEGKPSEKGLYLDAEAAVEYLTREHGLSVADDVVVFGRSLGCGVAVEVAARHQVRAVILESGFPSVQAMVDRTYPFLPSSMLLSLVEARYDSASKLPDVHAPVMVLHGDRDQTVSIAMGEELFESANEPRRFYTISGADHNDTYHVGGEAYFEALREFLLDLGP